jgi:leucyl/phenylalanyl-tRNA---protein transferase
MRPTAQHFPQPFQAATAQAAEKLQRRRAQLFREPAVSRIRRIALALAYQVMPVRIKSAPALGLAIAKSWLRGGVERPADADTTGNPPEFSGVIRNPTPESLLAAHRDGFFPQAHMGPLKWWTRENRCVQMLADRRIPKTLRNEMRKSRLVVTFDQAFDAVIKACAEPRPGRPKLTWVTPEIMHLYAALHDQGHAHSFEVWDEAGELVGGGYGVAVGRVFVTESLFSRSSSASKMGMQSLGYHLQSWGFILNDVKNQAPHFASIGTSLIPKAAYRDLLRDYAAAALPANPKLVPWRATATLAQIVLAGGGK